MISYLIWNKRVKDHMNFSVLDTHCHFQEDHTNICLNQQSNRICSASNLCILPQMYAYLGPMIILFVRVCTSVCACTLTELYPVYWHTTTHRTHEQCFSHLHACFSIIFNYKFVNLRFLCIFLDKIVTGY